MTSAALPSGVAIEYDTFGRRGEPPMLLVMGLGAQMIDWRDDLCAAFADTGRFVIRFDNRDCGLSTKFDDAELDLGGVFKAVLGAGPMPPLPYTLSDMAADAVGLLDALEIERAHVVGASMGGAIAQTIAIDHPDRLTSMTSIMSSTGDRDHGASTPAALEVLLSPPPTNREEAIERATLASVWSSRRYFDAGERREMAAMSYDRSFCPMGTVRQLAATLASDRTSALATVTVPTLVVHGLDDQLITSSGGRHTAEAIPGAHLLEVADMGHDLPRQLWPVLVRAITGHQDAAAAALREGIAA